jgi:hypothetical protein
MMTLMLNLKMIYKKDFFPIIINIINKGLNCIQGIVLIVLLQKYKNHSDIVEFYWIFSLLQSFIIFELGVGNIIVRSTNSKVTINPIRRIINFTESMKVIIISSVIMGTTLGAIYFYNKGSFNFFIFVIFFTLGLQLYANIYTYQMDANGRVNSTAIIRISNTIVGFVVLLYCANKFSTISIFLTYYISRFIATLILLIILNKEKLKRYIIIITYYLKKTKISFNKFVLPIKIGLTGFLGYWLALGLPVLLNAKISDEKHIFFGHYVNIMNVILFISNIYNTTYLFKIYNKINLCKLNDLSKFIFKIEAISLTIFSLLTSTLIILMSQDFRFLINILPKIDLFLIFSLSIIYFSHLSMIIDAYIARSLSIEYHHIIFILIMFTVLVYNYIQKDRSLLINNLFFIAGVLFASAIASKLIRRKIIFSRK